MRFCAVFHSYHRTVPPCFLSPTNRITRACVTLRITFPGRSWVWRIGQYVFPSTIIHDRAVVITLRSGSENVF